MARAKTEDLHKHTLNLRAGDMEKLAQLFPSRAPAVVIRMMVSKFIDRSMAAAKPEPVSTDLDL